MEGGEIDEAAVVAAWDANAERWAADVRAGNDLYRDLYTFPAFLTAMPDIAGRRVLDLGCGEGTNTRAFAGHGAWMTGIDLSAAMIAQAREAEAADPLGITYAVGSFTDLSEFDPESFDVVLSTMALMDGPDFAGAMRATTRLLRPDGQLCFSILHPCFITPAAKWLSAEGDQGAAGLRVGRYFASAPFEERWRFSRRPEPETVEPFRVPRFPRTLSDTLNAVLAAGLRITAIAEPRPDETAVAGRPWLARWREHAPLILIVSAVKA